MLGGALQNLYEKPLFGCHADAACSAGQSTPKSSVDAFARPSTSSWTRRQKRSHSRSKRAAMSASSPTR
jgi:hypothetical protein